MSNIQNIELDKSISLDSRESILVIAGLGNPEEKYNKTRHNAGFVFLDSLAKELGENWTLDTKKKCEYLKHGQLILIKPKTYMNNSGEAVQAVMSYYKLLPKKMLMTIKDSDLSEKLLVIHDDLDIEFGKYKFSIDSRAAGHNGVQSIIDHLKTKNFKRLRLGIKTDLLQHVSGKDFVLNRFSGEELIGLEKMIKEIISEIFIL
jgi:peptidyl-tRNA hydrolase, PTH1 family